MTNLKIYKDSRNYTCQVIRLPKKEVIQGLDNLVSVNVQGNDCLISKDAIENILYLFFPSECQLSHEFLSANNLYRHAELNNDRTKTGFFEDNRRVKAVKFRGVISSGFVCSIDYLNFINEDINTLKAGDEFNEAFSTEICKKYVRKVRTTGSSNNTKSKLLDEIIDSRFAPEHFDTEHLLKNTSKLHLDDFVAITYKLHGTSARYYNTLVKRKLSIIEKVAKFFGAKIQLDDYEYVCASRRVIKSCGFETLPNKRHFYKEEDLWSRVGKEYFEGKLNHGEAVYCEIVGTTYTGNAIQHGYTYGFNKPTVFIYRITNINSQGIEVDLPYQQVKQRAAQLDVSVCPEFYYGTLYDFIVNYGTGKKYIADNFLAEALKDLFYDNLLDRESIFDPTVVEEGFCLRVDKYPKPLIYKIKSPKFLLHEGISLDKQMVNIEDEESVIN